MPLTTAKMGLSLTGQKLQKFAKSVYYQYQITHAGNDTQNSGYRKHA